MSKSQRADVQSQSLMVLCQCSERVGMKTIPLDVPPVGGGELWTLHGPTEGEDTTVGDEGGTQSHSTEHRSPPTRETTESDTLLLDTASGNSAESIIRAVGDLLAKTMRPTQESNIFQCLRVYSGITPTPAGEENLDTWTEQARLMVDECDCSIREKRKIIVESLKGPALEIAQAVRANDPEAAPEEYIEALERAIGTSETTLDPYFSFRALRQSTGERLSDLLRRVEWLLTKVVQRGGLAPSQRDSARVEQLLWGATESDIMLLQLRLRERKNKPPSFLTLLNEIREEEDQQSVGWKAAPSSAKPIVRQVRLENDTNVKSKN
ncbi:paraneoplastic antigen Ma2 homolog [Thunnus thynnus]|uniref:paraneoplastic antigen Ma2 homolog n=1 Tax=Thunnus thynnus TaxID=8237 RepID=UPI0035281F9D